MTRFFDCRPNRPFLGMLLWGWLLMGGVGVWGAESGGPHDFRETATPLHARIDGLLEEATVDARGPVARDLEFLRRVTIDLVGRVPTLGEIEAFVAEPALDKRQQRVDQLLNSPEFARHMATVLDVMWMERRPEKYVKHAAWKAYLRQSLEENKPYDALVREILVADGESAASTPAARVLLDRECDPHLLTRDIGRLVFGRDYQCAQCHDHPLIGDYLQADYYGLFAFLQRSYVFTSKDKKTIALAEKGEGEAKYKSVFDADGNEQIAAPHVPGRAAVDVPVFSKEEAYDKPGDENHRPEPKVRMRALLAEQATRDNPMFDRNAANRLWAHMMGRGIVDPVDLHHGDNRPSHPELLDTLALGLKQLNYDIKAFLREIALSRAYQRSMAVEPEQLLAVIDNVRQQRLADEQLLATIEQRLDETVARLEALDDKRSMARMALAEAEQARAAAERKQSELQQSWEELARTAGATSARITRQAQAEQALASAIEAAQTAMQLLPEDADVSRAVTTLAERRQVLADRLAGDTPQLAEQQAALERVEAELKAATADYQAWDANCAGRAEAVATMDQNHDAARQRRGKDARQRRVLLRRIADAERLENFVAQQSEFTQLAARCATMEQDLADVDVELERTAAAHDASGERLAVAEEQYRGAATQWQHAQVNHERWMAVDNRLNTALETTRHVVAGATAIPAWHDALAALERAGQELTQPLQSSAVELLQHQQRHEEAERSLAKAREQAALGQAQLETLTARRAELQEQLREQRELAATLTASYEAAYQDLLAQWERQFAIAGLRALTPEEFASSILHVTGEAERLRAAARAEWEQEVAKRKEERNADAPGDAQDAAQHESAVSAEVDAREIETRFDAKIEQQARRFVELYGAGPGQPQGDFFATADQALFLSNGGTLQSWLSPRQGNLVHRMINEQSATQVAETLYLAALTRRPTAEETAVVTAYWQTHADAKERAARDLLWSLLTSAEFRFRH